MTGGAAGTPTRLLLLLLLLAACAPPRPGEGTRPSIALVVLDTVRFDAVSADGEIGGTTPVVDALAAEGILYRHAYANANWTLPSHVSLFTGLLPSEHGVSQMYSHAPDELAMLAERLRDVGYETVGISENPWIVAANNVAQGFDHFTAIDQRVVAGMGWLDIPGTVASWLASHDRDRPYFLFVNLMDAHAPYKVRRENPFLPAHIDPMSAGRVVYKADSFVCVAKSDEDLEVLWALYLGGVATADTRLGALLDQLREAGVAENLVTIVTSDHGEHFGEHRLVQHEYGVYEELVHVPLVVHGLRDARPGVIDALVQLVDIVPTVVHWAGLPAPEGVAGEPLPTAPGRRLWPRTLVAENIDPEGEEIGPGDLGMVARGFRLAMRRSCGPADRVDGTMRAVVRYPFKVISYAKYPPRLYDLSRDPREIEDGAARAPALVALLEANLKKVLLAARPPDRALARAPVTDPAALERLRALGYVGGPEKAE